MNWLFGKGANKRYDNIDEKDKLVGNDYDDFLEFNTLDDADGQSNIRNRKTLSSVVHPPSTMHEEHYYDTSKHKTGNVELS